MRVLFFTPYTAVWNHSFPEALLAEALKKRGHSVTLVSCFGAFEEYCISMSAMGVPPTASARDRKAVCESCRANKEILRKEMDLMFHNLQDFLTPEDYIKINQEVQSLTPENCEEYSVEGLALGRYALYEFLISTKRSDLKFSDLEWKQYLTAFQNGLQTYIATKRFIEKKNPDLAIVYNALYTTNATFAGVAKALGVPTYFIHAGPNLSERLETLIVGRGHYFDLLSEMKKQWGTGKNQPCTKSQAKSITNHFLELINAKSVFTYSSAKQNYHNINDKFEIKTDQRLVVAALSSEDELMAAVHAGFFSSYKSLPFKNQIEWVQSLVEFFKNRKDLFLLIRVHPREFPNKRDNKKSQHALDLKTALKDLPDNIRVNWPDDQISVFELADQAELFLNCWSSVGKEMPLLGIPVLTYCENLLGYAPDLNFCATNRNEYFGQLEHALKSSWDFERVRKAYRWHALEYCKATAYIGESFSRKEDVESSSFLSRVGRKIRKTILPHGREIQDCRKRSSAPSFGEGLIQMLENRWPSLLNLSTVGTVGKLESEEEVLRQELKRLYRSLYPQGFKPLSKLGPALKNFLELN